MKINLRSLFTPRTHEGAPAVAPRTPMAELRRAVASCLLWEDQFYEEGVDIAERIAALAARVDPADLAALAVEARTGMKLRHAPLWLLVALMKHDTAGKVDVAGTVAQVIRRADEMGELVALYWKDGKRPLPAAMKRGLAKAFGTFDAYQLAKYDRKAAVRLKDVLRLVHPKPADEAQAALWKQVVDGTLAAPDTWEVALSGGADKKETFERLIRENRLGYLALLRNLRNMDQSGVDFELVRAAILARRGAHNVFPFRFVAAARAAPRYEEAIDAAMLAELAQRPKLPGTTVVVIDVSGSMYGGRVSAKSDMDRALAASALGAIAREMCERPVIYATAGSDAARKHRTELVPPRRGMALVDAIHGLCMPLGGGGIFTKQVCDYLRKKEGPVDRMIVITDEQDCGVGAGDSPLAADPIGRRNYMINVASYRNGVAHGKWTAISGFSESVFAYVREAENVAG
jgi:hypothetical protein